MPKARSSFTFGVIAESPSDAEWACILADRILCDEIDWIDAETLLDFRQWMGLGAEAPRFFGTGQDSTYTKIHDVPRLAKKHKLPRKHGLLQGDLTMAHSALILFRGLTEVDAVLVVRDGDGCEGRRSDLAQVCAMAWPFHAIFALPNECMEAWILSGFQPGTNSEEADLKAECQRLGFNPTTAPERLSHKDPAPKSGKATLKLLTCDSRARQAECLRRPLAELSDRGAKAGLADYLDAVRAMAIAVYQ